MASPDILCHFLAPYIQLLFFASPFLAFCLLDAVVETNSLRHDWTDVYGHIWLVALDRLGPGGCTSSERAVVAGDPESPMVTTPMGPGGCMMLSDLSSDWRERELVLIHSVSFGTTAHMSHPFHPSDYYQ